MGSFKNNGPSFSGMRTFRMFYRTKPEPRTWFSETKSELRPEDRTVVSHRLLKLRATLKAKKQAKEKRARLTTAHGEPDCRCFLPDLAGFVGTHCMGPG